MSDDAKPENPRDSFLDAIADVRLDRGDGGMFLATAQAWDEILTLAAEYGWEPEHKPTLYRADVGLRVGEEDAGALADAVQEAIDDFAAEDDEDDEDRGLLDPRSVLKENADRLLELVAYCRQGAFTIR